MLEFVKDWLLWVGRVVVGSLYLMIYMEIDILWV